jgi:hypothetical protein
MCWISTHHRLPTLDGASHRCALHPCIKSREQNTQAKKTLGPARAARPCQPCEVSVRAKLYLSERDSGFPHVPGSRTTFGTRACPHKTAHAIRQHNHTRKQTNREYETLALPTAVVVCGLQQETHQGPQSITSTSQRCHPMTGTVRNKRSSR